MAYGIKVIADSVSEEGNRLTTLEAVFPRMVLAEFNTHRMFSRNSASSRAIPIEKQLSKIREDTFIPVSWGMLQKGMQADSELSITDRVKAQKVWMSARDDMMERAEELLALSVHKQITNRLLETFMWHTVIVTATEWDNFYALRANKNAQPEIRVAADLMLEAYNASTPKLVKEGEWHLPLIQQDEQEWASLNSEEAVKVSAARSGRTSYLTHANVRDTSEDVTFYDRLVAPGHMSPLEHVATPFSRNQNNALKKAKAALRRAYSTNPYGELALAQDIEKLDFTGNFRGWRQHRKDIPTEANFALVEQQ